MKPIIQEETQDTILTKDITEQHIVVAKFRGSPCILSKGYIQEMDYLTFFDLSDQFTIGNGFGCGSGNDTLKEMVEYTINRGYPIAVFHQSDWKQALQWLIDNA